MFPWLVVTVATGTLNPVPVKRPAGAAPALIANTSPATQPVPALLIVAAVTVPPDTVISRVVVAFTLPLRPVRPVTITCTPG